MSKYLGIDSRVIKCPCLEPNCIEAGISFDEDQLMFHFLDHNNLNKLTQITKSMKLDQNTALLLIESLKPFTKLKGGNTMK